MLAIKNNLTAIPAQESLIIGDKGNKPLRTNGIKETSRLADSDVNFHLGHNKIAEKLSLFRDNYKQFIEDLGALADFFAKIPTQAPTTPEGATVPCWSNKYLPQGDAIALCGFLFKYKPAVYVEIGSGNSTKFARRVISHFNLPTKIISIDPQPRSEIDTLCDVVIRSPAQMVPKSVFEPLRKNSILFIDGSHRCLQNSDVTYIFMDILPNLHPGVLIHFHDIFWPEDYPREWIKRLYSEQYLLGVLLLFGAGYEILYSSQYVCLDRDLNARFSTLLDKSCGGGSLWMRFFKEWS
jgi:hypothetical protein